VAIAIGQLVEADGESATVDLRATRHDGQTFGALRFYAPDHGYYNGAVRHFTVESGRIIATGGGVLVEPDGHRRLVRFTATIPLDGKAVSIAVQGFQGFAYTLEGDLKPGFVQAGEPGRRASATN